MEQSELNGIIQKWLEGLQQLQQPEQKSSDFGPLPVDGEQELMNVLEKLSTGLRITGALKTSLHAGALEQKDIDIIAGMLHTHVSRSIINLIGFTGDRSLASLFHDDVCDGFVRAFQMALFKKYEKMGIEGLMSTATKPPAIYVSMKGEIPLLQQICIRVGLPQSCITPVACSSLHGSTHTIDIEALEKQINEDCNVGKTPLLVIAYAGTPLAGHVDDLVNIRKICDQHSMWLHVTGHGLSSLCLPEEREEIKGFDHVDSFTLFPGTWFGVLSSPMITLHKHPKIIQVSGVPNSTNFPGETPADITSNDILIPHTSWYAMYHHGLPKLLSLPLWMCMQYLGSTALLDTISYCRSLTKNIMIRLDEIPGIIRLASPSHTSYVVLFKYSGSGQLFLPPSLKKLIQPRQPKPLPQETVDETNEEHLQEEVKDEDDNDPLVVTIHGMPLVLTNMYNIMISKDLHHLFPKVGTATYDMGHKDGVVFRFDPITSFPEYSTSVEDVERFTEELKNKVNAIHPIAQARCLFELALKNQPNLRWLEFPNIHCVAIMQYVKLEYIEKQDLTVDEVNSLNKLNIELSQHLNQFASVFQPFQHGNFTCLLIRELPKEMSVFDLLETVIKETANFESQKKELLGMAEKIRQGIMAAQEDITKEKEKAEGEESVFKHVPIIGSVFSWLYPPSPTGVTGRTFNLSSGKIEASSKIYENRMQLVDDEESKQQNPPTTATSTTDTTDDITTDDITTNDITTINDITTADTVTNSVTDTEDADIVTTTATNTTTEESITSPQKSTNEDGLLQTNKEVDPSTPPVN